MSGVGIAAVVLTLVGAVGTGLWLRRQLEDPDDGAETALEEAYRSGLRTKPARKWGDPVDVEAGEEEVPADPNSADPVERAYARGEQWAADAAQQRDAAKRDAAFAAIRAALEGDDPLWAAVGLSALRALYEEPYDKASFREPVLRHLQSGDPELRAATVSALPFTIGTAADVERIVPLVNDPSPDVRWAVGIALVSLTGKKPRGAASDALVRLLNDADRQVVRQALNAMWGITADESLCDQLLELHHGDDRELAHDALYFGLSTLPEKNPKVVAALRAAAATGERRAWYGLGFGVPESEHDAVATTLLQYVQARGKRRVPPTCLELIAKYAGDAHRADLQALAGNAAGSSAAVRTAAADVLARLDQRRND